MLLRNEMGDQSRNRNGEYNGMESAGMLPFRLLRYGEFCSDRNYFTEREGLPNWLFFATISGSGVLRYAGKEALLTPGKTAVIDCSRYQYYATEGEGTWDFFWMHFVGTAADAYVRLINGDGLRVMEWESWRAAELYGQLEELARTPGRQTDFMVSLWIHQILNELAQGAQGGAAARYQAEMLAAAEFLRENMEQPLRVRELARQSGLSEYHFLRVFKGVIGQPPYEYLTLLRVNRARQLLACTDRSVAEIAAQVGYPDVKGLIDNFKRRTGMTPGQFRRQMKNGGDLP